MDGTRKYGTVIGVGLGAAALALWAGVPLGTILLIGVVLLCPLMMMGMHDSGHEAHGSATRTESRPDARGQSTEEHHHQDAGRA